MWLFDVGAWRLYHVIQFPIRVRSIKLNGKPQIKHFTACSLHLFPVPPNWIVVIIHIKRPKKQVTRKCCNVPNIVDRLIKVVRYNSKLCVVYTAWKGNAITSFHHLYRIYLIHNNACDMNKSWWIYWKNRPSKQGQRMQRPRLTKSLSPPRSVHVASVTVYTFWGKNR